MTEKHTHRLKRHKYSTGNAVYFCTLNCHFKIECPLALGMKSICNICGQEFTMSEYSIKLAKPHCERCSKIKVKGSDGKNHYVRRDSLPVMASLAQDTAQDLRERLNAAVAVDSEEDI